MTTTQKNRKQLQKLVNEYYGHGTPLYKAYCASAARTGWIARPFNHAEVFLGKTLSDAFETLEYAIEN